MLIAASDSESVLRLLKIRDRSGLTPMGACIEEIRTTSPGKSFAAGPLILRELLRHGAKTETHVGRSLDYNGQPLGVEKTLLHYACGHRDRHWAIEVLLEAGADRMALDSNNLTPEGFALAENMQQATAIFTAYDARILRAKCLAFASVHHPRLGQDSRAGILSPDILHTIVRDVLERGHVQE